MIPITLDAVPNQNFTLNADGFRYEVTIKSMGDCMAVTIVRDDVTIVSNRRAVCGTPILPWEYLRGDGGSFAFSTFQDELPWWEKFGVTQTFFYLEAGEFEWA